VIYINKTEKFIQNFERWRDANYSSSEQKFREDLHKIYDPFIKEVQAIKEKYGVSDNQAACYVSNYSDDYICKRFNGGCKDISLCERISNGRKGKEVQDET